MQRSRRRKERKRGRIIKRGKDGQEKKMRSNKQKRRR